MVEGRAGVLEALERDLVPALDRVAFADAVGFTPDPWQADLLRSASSRVVLNCSRQSGKTTVAGLVALHRALYHPGSLILCLAPAQRQAQLLFGAAAAFYRALDRPVPAEAERKLSLELENGSSIVVLPGTEKTIRGFSAVDLLIVDEAARIPDVLYFAVRPMLAVSGGSLMLLSTPFGKRGVFFEEWMGPEGQGLASRDEWERYKVPATLVPRISREFLAQEKAKSPWFHAQEYMCEFMEVEDAVFDHDLVARAISDEVAALDLTGTVEVDPTELLAGRAKVATSVAPGHTTLPGLTPGEEGFRHAG